MAAVTAVAVVGLYRALDPHGSIHLSGDSWAYLEAARDPFRFTRSPFSFRLLAPLLARWLPSPSLPDAFAFLTVSCLTLTGVLLYVFLRKVYGGPGSATWGLALFLVSGTNVLGLQNPVLADPLAYCFLQGAFTLGIHGRWAAAGGALAVGVLAKEHVLFAVPALLWQSQLPSEGRRAWHGVALVTLPLLAYAVLHYTPVVFGSVPPSYDYLSLANVRDVLTWVTQWGSPPKLIASALMWSYNVGWLAAWLGFRRAPAEVRACVALPLCLVPTFFIATDWWRMLLYAFPCVVGLSCALRLSRVAEWTVLCVCGWVCVWAPLAPPSTTKHIATACALAVGAAALVASRRRTSGHDGS